MFLSSGLEIMRKIIPMNENMQEGSPWSELATLSMSTK